jgi:hypothetical protein
MRRARGGALLFRWTRGLLAVVVPAVPTPVAAPAPPSFHWRAVVTSAEARPGDKLQDAQVWFEGGRIRIEDRTAGAAPTNYLLTPEGVAYSWTPGGTSGMKMPVPIARRSGRPLHEYVRRLAEIRSRGKLVASERIDGHDCDVVQYETADQEKGTYWLARDLRDFPLRIRIERPQMLVPYRGRAIGTVKLEIRNSDVRTPSGIDRAGLSPPTGVRFDEVSDLFGNRGRTTPR